MFFLWRPDRPTGEPRARYKCWASKTRLAGHLEGGVEDLVRQDAILRNPTWGRGSLKGGYRGPSAPSRQVAGRPQAYSWKTWEARRPLRVTLRASGTPVLQMIQVRHKDWASAPQVKDRHPCQTRVLTTFGPQMPSRPAFSASDAPVLQNRGLREHCPIKQGV